MAFNKHEFLFFIRKKNLFFLGWGWEWASWDLSSTSRDRTLALNSESVEF